MQFSNDAFRTTCGVVCHLISSDTYISEGVANPVGLALYRIGVLEGVPRLDGYIVPCYWMGVKSWILCRVGVWIRQELKCMWGGLQIIETENSVGCLAFVAISLGNSWISWEISWVKICKSLILLTLVN